MIVDIPNGRTPNFSEIAYTISEKLTLNLCIKMFIIFDLKRTFLL